ncbi:MAG: hypothetical protein ABI402_11835 [Ferruginibacter sp.]
MDSVLWFLFEYIFIPLSIPVSRILISYLLDKKHRSNWVFENGFEIAIISFCTSLVLIIVPETRSQIHPFRLYIIPLLILAIQVLIVLIIVIKKKKYQEEENLAQDYFISKSFVLGLTSLSLHITLTLYCYYVIKSHESHLALILIAPCFLFFLIYLGYSLFLFPDLIYPYLDIQVNELEDSDNHQKVKRRRVMLYFIFETKKRIRIKKTIVGESLDYPDLKKLKICYLFDIVNYQYNLSSPHETAKYSELLIKESAGYKTTGFCYSLKLFFLKDKKLKKALKNINKNLRA